ncbi:hypothetical protein [Aureispira sp. CCB-QB1]|uniref:hypothetical protein n=1 Tax=Aureispira sp. CCB-QB1 TaxID=1313421 RepID=UPI000696E434|nr:hypothetical protein [Aureispira sp. CCB-QB1]
METSLKNLDKLAKEIFIERSLESLDELAKEIHKAQQEAGWYDNERSDNTLLLLIKSEMFECFEAYRKNKGVNPLSPAELDYLLRLSIIEAEQFKSLFELRVKDGMADEFADMVIRLLDFVAYKKITIIQIKRLEISFCPENYFLQLDERITSLYNKEVKALDVGFIFETIDHITAYHGFDLRKHIELKLAYNKLRGKRHGNKKI